MSSIVCDYCDSVYAKVALPPRAIARCERCDATLYRSSSAQVDKMLAVSIVGSAYRSLLAAGPAHEDSPIQVWQDLVAHGMRAQTRSASLITGSPYIAWAFFPHAKPATVEATPDALIVPTENGMTDQIENRIQSILAKVDELPFKDIGEAVRAALQRAVSLFITLDRAFASIAPDAKKLFADAEGPWRRCATTSPPPTRRYSRAREPCSSRSTARPSRCARWRTTSPRIPSR